MGVAGDNIMTDKTFTELYQSGERNKINAAVCYKRKG